MNRKSASKVVLGHSSELSSWGKHQINTSHFKAYLRKSIDNIQTGDMFEEFVGVGCCGNTLDISFIVISVETDDDSNSNSFTIDETTKIEYIEKESCPLKNSGWKVQSEMGA